MNYDPLADLISLIARRFHILFVTCLLAGGLAVVYTWSFVPRQYVSGARLLYEGGGGAIPSGLSAVAARLGMGAGGGANVGPQLAEILNSRRFALKMIRQFALAARWGKDNELEAVPIFRAHLGVEARLGGVLGVTFWLKGSPRGLSSPGEDKETAQLGADIVNAMVDELQQYRGQITYDINQRQRTYVEQRLKEIEEMLQEALAQLATFQQKTGIMQPEVQLQAAYSAIGNIDSALAKARAEAEAARQTAEAASQTHERASMVEAQTSLIAQIKGSLVELQMQLARAQQVERKTAAHPEVRGLLAEIQDARLSLAEELGLEVDALAVKQMVAETQVEALAQERRRLHGMVEKFPVGSVEYVERKASIELLVQARAVLYQEREVVAMQQEASYRPFEILDPAVPPARKSGPPTRLNAVAAAFLASLVALFILARREKRPAVMQQTSKESNQPQ